MSYDDPGASLTFLDPDEEGVVGADTQGEDFRFDFTVPSQDPRQGGLSLHSQSIEDKIYLVCLFRVFCQICFKMNFAHRMVYRYLRVMRKNRSINLALTSHPESRRSSHCKTSGLKTTRKTVTRPTRQTFCQSALVDTAATTIPPASSNATCATNGFAMRGETLPVPTSSTTWSGPSTKK